MNTIKVALIGMGRMGAALEALAGAHDCEVVARIDAADPATRIINADTLRGADVAIEFTVPDAAIDNATRCLEADVPVVIGTTGWYDQLDKLAERARNRGGRVL